MLQSQPSKDGLQGTMLQAPEPFWVMSRNCHVKDEETAEEPSRPPSLQPQKGITWEKEGENWSYVIPENRVRVRVGSPKGLS